MGIFFLVHSCQILTSIRAGHGGGKKHVLHITSVKDFYEGPRISQNIVELLLLRSINCFRGKVSGDEDTHQRAQASWNFNPLFLCRRSPTSNPKSGQVESSSALAVWSGFFSKCCYSSELFRSAVLANANIQQSLNALRAPNRFEGWPEATRWMNCPKIFF